MTDEPRKRWFVQMFEIIWSRPWTLVIFLLLALLVLGFVKIEQAGRIIDLLKGMQP